jgi:hypothetical protein
MSKFHVSLLGLALLLPLTAQAADSPQGIRAEIQADMAEGRAEVRAEMAKARRELDIGNLELGNSVSIGKHRVGKRDDNNLPPAHITPSGDLVIDNTTVAVSAIQRSLLLDYRRQVIDLAKAGIDTGEKVAMAALEVTDVSLFRLITSAMSGSLERRIERTVKRELAPMAAQICGRLPRLLAAQHVLTVSVPQFQPYATLDQPSVDGCESEFTRSLAMR